MIRQMLQKLSVLPIDLKIVILMHIIDLKSILGVLSFGLPKDIDINIMGPEIDIEIFNKAIKKWRV